MRTLTAVPASPDRRAVPGGRGRGGLARVRRAAAELTPEAIEQIAQRVAELLRHDQPEGVEEPTVPAGLFNASQLARHLGVTRAWVYEHALELGAIRLGTGPRARLRFDPERATGVLRAHAPEPGRDSRPTPRSKAPRGRPRETEVPLLPINPPRTRGALLRLSVLRRTRGI